MLTLINFDAIIELTGKQVLKRDLRHILKKCVKEVEEFQNRSGFNTLRANIMIKKKDRLIIIASYNMDNSKDKDISFAVGQGCCGDAYESKAIVVGDLKAVYKNSWMETRTETGAPWGITHEQFEKTKDLKSLISMPIKDMDSGDIVGLLCIDDVVGLEETMFDYEELQIRIGAYTFYISEKIIKEGM